MYYNKFPSFIQKRTGWIRTIFNPQSRVKNMACFMKSKCFTQGINLVAQRSIPYTDHITPQKLHQLYLQGCIIDFKCLKDIQNKKPNVGRKYFRLLNPEDEIHEISVFKEVVETVA